MPHFRKKPVVIEAMQLSLDTADEIRLWLAESEVVVGWRYQTGEGGTMIIPTLEGDMQASEGDWVIKGVQGEFYPCKPDIFEATYEAVEQ